MVIKTMTLQFITDGFTTSFSICMYGMLLIHIFRLEERSEPGVKRIWLYDSKFIYSTKRTRPRTHLSTAHHGSTITVAAQTDRIMHRLCLFVVDVA